MNEGLNDQIFSIKLRDTEENNGGVEIVRGDSYISIEQGSNYITIPPERLGIFAAVINMFDKVVNQEKGE